MSLRPKASSSSSASSAPKSTTRLFISNLASGVTDAALATLFKPFGRIVSLSLIFHTTGPLKGHSKGYAFVEFSNAQEAERARSVCEGRRLGGREIGVGFANVQELPPGGSGPHRYVKRQDPARPTTLSLLKNTGRPSTTQGKIAAMEAKLASIRRREEGTDQGASSSAGGGGGSSLLAPAALKKAGLPNKPETATTR